MSWKDSAHPKVKKPASLFGEDCGHEDEMRRSIPEDATLKKNSNSQTKSGQKTKPTKARGPVQRDSKEVMAELVAKLSEKLEQKPAQEKAAGGKPQGAAPNRDRLTVGVDLGDQWSNYWCRFKEQVISWW